SACASGLRLTMASTVILLQSLAARARRASGRSIESQENGETGPPRRRFHGDGAARLFENLRHQEEPRPGFLPPSLCREEGIEDPRQHLGVDSGTVVDDAHARNAARLVDLGLEPDLAAPTERLYRVVNQVGPDLIELVHVDGDSGQRPESPHNLN